MSTPTPTTSQIQHTLLSQSFPLVPSPLFLSPILTPPNSQRALPPLAALIATTKHRLLSTNLTSAGILSNETKGLPLRVNDVGVKEIRGGLKEEVVLQVLDVRDVGRSRGDVLLALEGERVGERREGRKVVRVVDSEAEGGEGGGAGSGAGTGTIGGPYKLLLQDWKGNTIWGFEEKRVQKIDALAKGNMGMGIGGKLVLRRGTRVARGVVLLDDGCCTVLGGRVEALDKEWREGLEERIRKEIEAMKVPVRSNEGEE